MAVVVICGKSGQGKTAYAVHSLMKRIEESKTFVLTNVPLTFNYIRSWVFIFRIPLSLTNRFTFIRKLPFVYNHTFSSSERVITWKYLEQVYDFMDICLKAMEIKDSLQFEIYKADVMLKWETKGIPFYLPKGREFYLLGFVLFVDEAGGYFNSREFRKTPPEFLMLINQHRKMKIDLICTVQRLGNLDNHIRDSAHITLIVNRFRLFMLPMGRWHKVQMVSFDPLDGTRGHRVFYDLMRRSKFIESVYDTYYLIEVEKNEDGKSV
jgi:hypothetical protein